MSTPSPKLNFLRRTSDDTENNEVIQIERNEYRPHAVMQRMHGSLARTKINVGGMGSGKTRGMGEHLNALALAYPGANILIGRKDLTTLKETTQKEFLEQVVVPETIDTFNVNENKLYYKNGSAVLFRETKDPAKVKSLQLVAYGLDESDENESPEIWERLDERLRQPILIDGVKVNPPYCGILTLNPPPTEEHWIIDLSSRKDLSLEVFRSTTYDNQANLPEDYIPNLVRKLAPWDVKRLVYGEWGASVRGKPVIHGFSYENNVRSLKLDERYPLLRGWDFGFNHPSCSFMQIDPVTGRLFKLRELLGKEIYLPDFVEQVKKITRELCGPSYAVKDFGDPHGADKKDVGESSIEYLRNKHQIFVLHKRAVVRTGLDEIQDKVVTKAPIGDPDAKREDSLFLVDHSCKITIAAYMGGYHRDTDGKPVKDGYYDHVTDSDRYVVVNTMNPTLAHRMKQRKGFVPRNSVTGY